MHVGQVISGSGHVVLIGWVLLGGLFQSDPLPIEATEVSVISGADFEALLAARQPATPETGPETETEIAQPAQPEGVEEPPVVPQVSEPVEDAAAPEVVATPPADDAPEVTELTAPPEAEVSDTPPEQQTPPEETAVLVPNQAEQAVPLPSDRVAPEPVAQPDPEAALDPVQQDAVVQSDTGETPQEPQEATAPEAAADQIVTEAEKPAAAPRTSVRPPARRPTRPAAAPAADPVVEPEPRTAESTSSDTDAAVQAALEAALNPPSDAPAAPSGPPMSAGEKDVLRVAVSSCWNVGSLSSDALKTSVTLGVSMTPDGKPVSGSVTLLGSEGGTAAAAKQAYETARRAIIRCGARGYDLPADKYEQWKEIEMTFNPERMRIK